MKKLLTLCIIQRPGEVLLGLKKRGHGVGHWNGFGGKVNKNESIEEAAKREVLEESGVSVHNIRKVAVIEFVYKVDPEIWETHLFTALDYTGDPAETEEMSPKWFGIDNIPYDTMWPDDKYWFPIFLKNKNFKARFKFDKNNKILEWNINENE